MGFFSRFVVRRVSNRLGRRWRWVSWALSAFGVYRFVSNRRRTVVQLAPRQTMTIDVSSPKDPHK